jgi:hypothetical protein
MATSRPFAYVPGSTIAGTQKVGDIVIGTPDGGFEATGVPFWNGPDEELGYVIAKPVSNGDQGTPLFTNSPLTFDPTYKPADVSLSNSNKTAYVTQWAYTQTTLTGTLINNPDKVMFSLTYSSTNQYAMNAAFIGVGTREMNTNGPFDGFPGNDSHSVGFAQDGNYYYNGGIAFSGLPTWVSGDTIDIAVDLSSGNKIWIRVNGGYWNGDDSQSPETGVCSLGMGGITNFYPALCPGSGGGTSYGSMTLLTTPPYGVPSGFNFLGTNVNASVGFLRTTDFTDETFLALIKSHFNQDLPSGLSASAWLSANGYWTSYATPILYLDAGNTASYPTSGTIWTDLVGGVTFSLSSLLDFDNGQGCLTFDAANGDYAQSNTSLSSLNNWSVGVWHYYTGNNIGAGMCLVTEVYPGINNRINYSLGDNDTGYLSSAFFDGGWRTSGGYALTPNNWYYIVGTYDGVANNLYVNGTLVSTNNYNGSPISSNGGIRLMRRWDNPDYWDGKLATVEIYDKSLSSFQITSKWNLTKSRFGFGTASFTITTADIASLLGNGAGITTNGLLGYTSAGNDNIIFQLVNYALTSQKLSEITNIFTANGLGTNYDGYIFNVTWGAGSSISSGLVRIGLSSNNNQFLISAVDTAYNDWYTNNNPGNPVNLSLAGSFYFPATFTLYTPVISSESNYWC